MLLVGVGKYNEKAKSSPNLENLSIKVPYFAMSNEHFLPKFLREKQGCVLYMGGTNSVSIYMFLIILFMLIR